MAKKKIVFTDPLRQTELEMSFDREEKEIMINVSYDEQEAFHCFRSPAEVDDFIDELNIMKNKLTSELLSK